MSSHETVLAFFDKVVKQRRVSLFSTQLSIEGALTMLSLETPFNFKTNSWGIQVCEENEADLI
jgi:hypothetical protein